MAKVEKRIIVDEKVNDYIDFYDVLDGKTPDQVVEAMKYYQDQYTGRDIYFNIDTYGYDGGKELTLRERRLENDKEYEKRMAEVAKDKNAKRAAKLLKEEKEFAEYQRLQKKFQGKSGFQ